MTSQCSWAATVTILSPAWCSVVWKNDLCFIWKAYKLLNVSTHLLSHHQPINDDQGNDNLSRAKAQEQGNARVKLQTVLLRHVKLALIIIYPLMIRKGICRNVVWNVRSRFNSLLYTAIENKSLGQKLGTFFRGIWQIIPCYGHLMSTNASNLKAYKFSSRTRTGKLASFQVIAYLVLNASFERLEQNTRSTSFTVTKFNLEPKVDLALERHSRILTCALSHLTSYFSRRASIRSAVSFIMFKISSWGNSRRPVAEIKTCRLKRKIINCTKTRAEQFFKMLLLLILLFCIRA